MTIRDLLPDLRHRKNMPVRREEWSSPFLRLQQEMNRIFDDYFGDLSPVRLEEGFGGYFPRVDVKETSKEIRVEAELPGMDEKDINISISENVLSLHGEKRVEKEEKEAGVYRSERAYGSFHRDILLPYDVISDQVEAIFKKGVLTIHLPKKPDARRKARRIEIKSE